jgi:uncharacterized protein YwgA
MMERFRWLAAAIAAHPERKVVGRTRLQKEIRLLQRLKFPTEYSYTLHFYGPYSEGLHAEIGLLENLGLIEEESQVSREGAPYYILRAKAEATIPEIGPFQKYIDLLGAAPLVVLELAATYDMFRTQSSDHKDAMERMRRKKGSKCDGGNEAAALELLKKLGLPNR